LILLAAAPAFAQEGTGYVGLLDQAKAAIAAGDYKAARALLTQAEAAAPGSEALIQEKDLARLPFYKGAVEWRNGDKDTAALNYFRDAITLSAAFQPEADVLPESDAQDVYYALIGEVQGRESITLGLPEDPGDALIFVDGRRMEAFDAVLVGTHFIQLRCGEGNVVGSWYTFGAPPPDYLTLCAGGTYPVAKGGKAPRPAKGPSKADLAKAEKEAAKKAAADAALAERAAKELAAKEAADRAAAEKAAADKLAAEATAKADADKAGAVKAAADATAKADADKAAAAKVAADKAAAEATAKAAAEKTAKADADKAAADKAAAEKTAKAGADKAAADKAAAEKTAKATAEKKPKASADKGGGAVGWAMIAGGGAMMAGGGVVNFLVVNPAWADAQAANDNPASVTRSDADAIVSRFNGGRYATIGLLAAGVATAGVGVFLGPLESHVYFTPTGLGLSGRW